MIISTEQVGEILQDIFLCGWNDCTLANDYRQYNNALVQLIYNFGRLSNNDNSLVTFVDEKYKKDIETYITIHFTVIDFTQQFS
jgi:hypothetical protein